MITDAEYEQWLNNPESKRVVLVDLYHADGVVHVSDKPYLSRHDDSVPNRPYLDCLAASVDITTRAEGAVQVGDIELVDDGTLTHWVDYKWRGFDVVFLLGDLDWPLSDFRRVAKQTNAGLSEARRGVLRFTVMDTAIKLEQPIARTRVNGAAKPLVLGRTFGGSALRVNSSTLQYVASELPLSDITVRDGNGALLTVTKDLANGAFTLSSYTPRDVFVECVQAYDTAAQIIQYVAAQYGLTVASTVADLPAYAMGLRYDNDVTGRQILDDVAASIGAYWYLDLVGAIHMNVRIDPAQSTPAALLTADDIELGKLELLERIAPLKSLTLEYDVNHSPLGEVAGSIEASDASLAQRLRAESARSVQTQTLAAYPLANSLTVRTALVNASDASSEAIRRLTLRSMHRDVYQFDAWVTTLAYGVGQVIELKHPRLNNRRGIVVRVSQTLGKDKLQLEVLF